jgi:two-component system sensor histidine kinase HydH
MGLPGLSPLVIIGIFVILVPIFVLMTIDNIREQQGRIKEKLTGKGLLLIRSFEAGTRTGMITTRWGGKRVQRLLAETAEQPEIEYMMITDRGGRILAHSDETKVGQIYEKMPDIVFDHGKSPLFHREFTSKQGVNIFEVYKEFTPARRKFRYQRLSKVPPGCLLDKKGNVRHCPPPEFSDEKWEGAPPIPGKLDWFRSHFSPLADGEGGSRHQVIFAAINMKEIDRIKHKAVSHAIFMGILFFALGGVGVVCVVALQGYRSARSSLSRVKAFSDEVIANMPAGLITVGKNMEINSCNGAALEILGPVKQEGTVELPPEMAVLAKGLKETTKKAAGEISCTVHGDRQLLLDVTVSSIFSEGGGLSGYLFLFHDLTEFKAMKKEVDRNRRLAAVGKLAAGVAHEIRNPLSSIKGFATWFFERYEEIPEDREVAGIMIQEVERLNRAVTQLLEFARPVPVVKKRVNIKEMIDHSLRLIAPDLKKQQIAVKTFFETDTLWLNTDPDRVNQILLNLYLNSLQAMDTMGTLSVTVTNARAHSGIVIVVADTGRGISEGDLDKIFDLYFTTRSDGTGLGLAMVYRAVEALGGDIWVESPPGAGTRFFIGLGDAF